MSFLIIPHNFHDTSVYLIWEYSIPHCIPSVTADSVNSGILCAVKVVSSECFPLGRTQRRTERKKR